MARIRTIKPEFWTDETIVRLPFVARLLFIGLWNFADDCGALEYSPDRIRLQILPAEHDCDITGLLDLLAAAELIDYWVSEQDGTCAISITGWSKHQKIDNPSRKTVIREGYRKKAIPSESRVAVAKKYGCPPGGSVDAACYYCGMPGKVHWWNGSNGKPTRWITLSDLEFDHFVSEHSGGDNRERNLVLACRACNRGKREFDPHQFFAKQNPSIGLDRNSETSPLDQGSRIKDQGEEKEAQPADPAGSSPPEPDGLDIPAPLAPPDDSSAGRPRAEDVDPVKAIFDLGIPILTAAGHTERAARSLIGRLRKLKGDEQAASVLVAAKSKTDPATYIAAATLPEKRRVQLC